MTGRNILVTGGAGFLGSHTAERLSTRNRVTVLDDLSRGAKSNLAHFSGTFVRLKAWSLQALNWFIHERFDDVVHLAANSYIPDSIDRPLYDFDTNLAQPLNLLETLRQLPAPPRLVLISSAAVHGRSHSFPMKESDRILPVSPYGAGKAALEYYGKAYHDIYGLPVQVVRLFPLYGPRQKKQVVYDIIRKYSAGTKTVQLFGTGKEERDFLYVDDAVRGLQVLLDNAPFDGSVVNLCTGQSVSIARVARCIRQTLGSQKPFRFSRPLRDGDVDKMAGSTVRIRKLGFQPRVSFQEGIQKTVDWFRTL